MRTLPKMKQAAVSIHDVICANVKIAEKVIEEEDIVNPLYKECENYLNNARRYEIILKLQQAFETACDDMPGGCLVDVGSFSEIVGALHEVRKYYLEDELWAIGSQERG